MQPRRRRQRERQKGNRFGLAKQELCRCITLFCTFLCRHCTTTTWKRLISRFEETVNRRQRLSFSFPVLWHSPLEFNSRKICQHLTNWTRRNKRHKVWGSANALFKWRFRSRRRRRCFKLTSIPYFAAYKPWDNTSLHGVSEGLISEGAFFCLQVDGLITGVLMSGWKLAVIKIWESISFDFSTRVYQ